MLAGDDQLRADAVRRGCEKVRVVEGIEAGEGAEALRARRFDGVPQALDDGLGRRERDPGLGVRLAAHRASLCGPSAKESLAQRSLCRRAALLARRLCPQSRQ